MPISVNLNAKKWLLKCQKCCYGLMKLTLGLQNIYQIRFYTVAAGLKLMFACFYFIFCFVLCLCYFLCLFIFVLFCCQVGNCPSDLIKTELGDSLLHLGGSSANSRLMARSHNNNPSPQHHNENGRLDGIFVFVLFCFTCSCCSFSFNFNIFPSL